MTAATPRRQLRLLVVSLNYLPEQTGFAPHIADSAEWLVAHGHRVTVLTGFPFSPQWRRWPEYRRRVFTREEIRGVEVLRASHYVPRDPGGIVPRVMLEGSFSLLAPLALGRARQSNWNLILYCGAQPSLAMLSRWLAWWKGIPYVVNIQDLATHAAVDVGLVRHSALAGLLERFENAAYRGASRALVLCDAFRTALGASGYPPDRIHLVRSPIDVDHIRPVPADGTFRRRHGLAEDDFVVLSAGSMGLKQGLTNVIEAARQAAAPAPRVKWVLVGDGELRPRLARLVAAHRLEAQVRLLPLQPREDLPQMFAAADLLLLNQIGEVKATVIPSKLLTYMAAGRPVLAAVSADSQGAALLRESAGGEIIEPDKPSALAEAVLGWERRDPRALDAIGRSNRQFAEEHLDRKRILSRQEEVLVEAAFREADAPGVGHGPQAPGPEMTG